MNEEILALKAALETCFTGQSYFTVFWHENEPEQPAALTELSVENLRNLVILQHYYNFLLWHVEDTARRKDVEDSVIADCKRRVDTLNQKRNDCIESVDNCLYCIITPFLPQKATARQNTETVGMALDRLSILTLKIYHMQEQTKRKDVSKKHIVSCVEKLVVLQRQHKELIKAILELITDYHQGNKVPTLYMQFKMYNDPNLNPELYTRSSAS